MSESLENKFKRLIKLIGIHPTHVFRLFLVNEGILPATISPAPEKIVSAAMPEIFIKYGEAITTLFPNLYFYKIPHEDNYIFTNKPKFFTDFSAEEINDVLEDFCYAHPDDAQIKITVRASSKETEEPLFDIHQIFCADSKLDRSIIRRINSFLDSLEEFIDRNFSSELSMDIEIDEKWTDKEIINYFYEDGSLKNKKYLLKLRELFSKAGFKYIPDLISMSIRKKKDMEDLRPEVAELIQILQFILKNKNPNLEMIRRQEIESLLKANIRIDAES